MSDDVELLLAWRGGDEEAGNRLARRHFQDIYTFFRTKAPDGAEDLTQQTFLHAVRARDRVDERGGFRAYLFGIARHRLLHHWEALAQHANRVASTDGSMEASHLAERRCTTRRAERQDCRRARGARPRGAPRD